MIFYNTECVGERITNILEAFDPSNEYRWIPHLFGRGAADEVWMKSIAEAEPSAAILSGDCQIFRNAMQRQIRRECNLTFVCYSDAWMHHRFNDQAWMLLKVWPRVIQDVTKSRQPSLFELKPKGPKVERRCFIAELRR